MNLKQIEAASKAYDGQLVGADAARLAFFRRMWEVQDGCTPKGDVKYQLPSERQLRKLLAAGSPVFSEVPVTVDATALALAIEKVCACAIEHGGFPEEQCAGLARTKWDRIVAASDLALAGSKPEEYVLAAVDLLADDGLPEDTARMGAMLVSLALRTQLERPAQAAMDALRATGEEFRPVTCPVCGGAPSVASVGGAEVSHTGGKRLWCAQCGTVWEFERVRCARCGMQNQAHLHYYNIEGDEAHRIATCDECGGYVRTVYSDDALAPFSFEVEDVVMARLDAVANDPTFAGGQG